jgi:hypothetical protein
MGERSSTYLGFDVGNEAAQGMPRRLFLVNPLANLQTPTTSVSHSRLKPRERRNSQPTGWA